MSTGRQYRVLAQLLLLIFGAAVVVGVVFAWQMSEAAKADDRRDTACLIQSDESYLDCLDRTR